MKQFSQRLSMPVLLLGMMCLMAGCQGNQSPPSTNLPNDSSATATDALPDPNYKFPYNLNAPTNKINLPTRLGEISGLTLLDSLHLGLVQDEKGIVFLHNLETGQPEKEIPFGKNGDYEGIATVGETIWVVRSNGALYKVNKLGNPNQTTQYYPTFLEQVNDVEGLCYDQKNHRLLLACKGASGQGK